MMTQKPDEMMMSKVEEKLNKVGVTIPDAPTPAANYLPFAKTGNLVFVSGQVPFVDGELQMDHESVHLRCIICVRPGGENDGRVPFQLGLVKGVRLLVRRPIF